MFERPWSRQSDSRKGGGMKTKVLRAVAFTALLVTGALTASAVAGGGPLVILQTESSSTSSSTSTGSTTTVTTATTATTTTTAARKITICHHARAKSGAVKHVTIRISRSAWNAHQKHGD